jgi:hypothetical protein
MECFMDYRLLRLIGALREEVKAEEETEEGRFFRYMEVITAGFINLSAVSPVSHLNNLNNNLQEAIQNSFWPMANYK